MNILPGGILVFPHKGNPPPDIPNYDRDVGDPFIFRPGFKQQCKYRKQTLRPLPCGKVKCIFLCSYFSTETSVAQCNKCEVEDK